MSRHAWRAAAIRVGCAAACAALFVPAAVAGGDAQAGAALYQARCSGCHSMDRHAVGPAYRGIYGRAAASVSGFGYSSALKAMGVVWGDDTLDRWLADPKQPMLNHRVSNTQDRADLIAHLKQVSEAKPQ
jgi:cytochrome c